VVSLSSPEENLKRSFIKIQIAGDPKQCIALSARLELAGDRGRGTMNRAVVP
jgi:hypothetical protein